MNVHDVGSHIEERIADHFVSTSWSSLPASSRGQAVRAVLWWIATALEGATEPDQARLIQYVAGRGGATEATILGSDIQGSAELAGLVNGRAAKAWEHEDKYWVNESIGFGVGCCVVSAAVAAAEARGGVTGHELITAVALGIDFEIRLLRPLGLGFVPGSAVANATFVLGTYGAALAAGKIYGLDRSEFLDALGIAHSQAAGNFQGQFEGRGVALQAGVAVRNGLESARLASLGMEGPRASITGVAGLYQVHYPRSAVDFESIVEGLGQHFFVDELGFKGYPCGIVAHPAIDAAASVRNAIAGRGIEAIEITGPESLSIMAQPLERKRAPRTSIEAQFSIPWAVACALRDGGFTIEHCTDGALGNEDLLGLSDRVCIEMSPTTTGTTVRVVLADGTVIEPPTVMAAKGHPLNPLSTSTIRDLVLHSAGRVGIRRSSTEKAVDLLLDVDSLSDIRTIMQLLSDHDRTS
ncbi:MmgE/PrpD family protein [Arthrobacter sp. NPDC093128]|uniref:MmgE/PrpD family protein n=1 Tax=Arthrobacter sp. NPDC093128 TaxID=3154979 RepID=UPI00341FEE40